jgi:hypothetical protein
MPIEEEVDDRLPPGVCATRLPPLPTSLPLCPSLPSPLLHSVGDFKSPDAKSVSRHFLREVFRRVSPASPVPPCRPLILPRACHDRPPNTPGRLILKLPHPSSLIPHPSALLPSSCLMPHAPCLTPHASLLMPHAARLRTVRHLSPVPWPPSSITAFSPSRSTLASHWPRWLRAMLSGRSIRAGFFRTLLRQECFTVPTRHSNRWPPPFRSPPLHTH